MFPKRNLGWRFISIDTEDAIKSNDPGRVHRVRREGKPGSCPEEETLGRADALEAENPLSGAIGVEGESYRD